MDRSGRVRERIDTGRRRHSTRPVTGRPPDLDDASQRRLTGPVVQTPNIETQGILSPDGRWLAYTSNLTAASRCMSKPSRPARAGAGIAEWRQLPAWRRDGKELFYLLPDVYADVMRVRSSKPLEFEPRVALFQFFSVERGVAANTPPYARHCRRRAVHRGGGDARAEPSINVLLNWPALHDTVGAMTSIAGLKPWATSWRSG
jgi:hypothetical protein